jgi:hypothetical protein
MKMPLIPLIVVNQTNNTLIVRGSKGDDILDVSRNSEIPANSGKIVAWYNTPGDVSDNWGWVYLENIANRNQYQIYVEWVRPSGHTYASFGYRDDNSSQRESNPRPFPPGSAMTNYTTSGSTSGWAGYILQDVPPDNSSR